MTTRRSGGSIPFAHGVAFLAIALAWSGLFWGLAAIRGAPIAEEGTRALFLAGGAGVPAAALGLLLLADGRAARRDYAARLCDPRLLGATGAAIALCLPVAIAGLAATFAGGGPEGATAPLRTLAADPATLAGLLVFLLVFGPLPEEMGWRGYALPAIQPRLGALAAALAIGVVHALWHVPLFLVPGTYQAGLGFGGAAFWRFLVALLFLSVVATWLFNRTRGSTASAVLLHFADNAAGELTALSPAAEWLRFALWGAVAAVILAATRGRLGREAG